MAKTIEIALEIKRETEKAYLVNDGSDDDNWIPKSQVDIPPIVSIGDTITVKVPEWLAKAKGFI